MNAKGVYRALVATMAFVAACNSRATAPATPSADHDSIKSLGSSVPDQDFDRSYWQKEHDAKTVIWQKARQLCEQTILANYPNCLPVADVLEADEKMMAEIGDKAAAKNKEMYARGYLYDFDRRSWLPYRQLMAAGCSTVSAYPNDLKRIGFSTWNCPQGTEIPKGIVDPGFREEEEHATD